MLQIVKSKLQKISCPLCYENKKIELLDKRIDYGITKNFKFKFVFYDSICLNCGFVFAAKVPSDSFLFNYYSDSHLRISKLLDISNHFDKKSRIKIISKYIDKKATILEVGANDGQFTQILNQLGYVAKGLDPLESKSSDIQGDVFLGSQSIQKNYYDCIVCYYVLEHIKNPSKWLGFIKNFLNPGGILILEIPNYYDYPEESLNFEHLLHFSPLHLKYFLESNGFEILSCNKEKPSRYFGFVLVAKLSSKKKSKKSVSLRNLKNSIKNSKNAYKRFSEINDDTKKFDHIVIAKIISNIKNPNDEIYFWAANKIASRINKKLQELTTNPIIIVDSADSKINSFHEHFKNKIISPKKIYKNNKIKIFVICSPNYFLSIKKQIYEKNFKKFKIIYGFQKINF